MTVAFRSVAGSSNSGTSVTINTPTGVQPNDVLLATITAPGTGSGVVSAPTGWTRLTPAIGQRLPSRTTWTVYSVMFAYTVPSGGAPASFAFTASTTLFLSGFIAAFSGATIDRSGASQTATAAQSTTWDAQINTFESSSPWITTTLANEFVFVVWASAVGTTITLPGGLTSVFSQYPGAGNYWGQNSGYGTGPATPGTYDPGSASTASATYWEDIVVTLRPNTPYAPTLNSPASGTYADIYDTGGPFAWTYNPGGTGVSETGYQFLRNVSGGANSYWNAGTPAFQSTAITNTSTATSLTFPTTVWANDTTYQWSVASNDANGLGPFAANATVNTQFPPTITISAPTGTVSTTQTPTVTWTNGLDPGWSSVQGTYRVVTYSQAQYTAAGFTPGSGPSVDDSGTVGGAGLSYTIATSLANNTTYRSYLQISQSPGGQTSSWQFTGYTIALEAPAAPAITATVGTDPVTGCPRIALALQAYDNLLTANDANLEGGLGSWVAASNCTVAQSTAQALDGTHSLLMTPSAAGTMQASTATGTSGYTVLPSTSYTAMASFRAGASARSCTVRITWYTSGGTSISSLTSSTATDGTGGWVQASVTGTSPSNAAFAAIFLTVNSTSGVSDVHYADEIGLFPGGNATWTRGGFVNTTTFQVLRSDGVYVRGASSANPLSVPWYGQGSLVYDYEATPGTAYTYTAQVFSTSLGLSGPTTTSNSATVATAQGFWTLDPTNVSSACHAQITTWNPQNFEQSSAHPVLGQTTVNVVASVVQSADMVATYKTLTTSDYNALHALTIGQKTVFVSDPYGYSYYFRLAPAPGGMSSGSGNKTHDTQLEASTSSNPVRTVNVTAIGQPRPQV